jgi:integrase
MESIMSFINKCFRVFQSTKESETLYPRLLRYLNEAHRDGVIGDGRYKVALGKAEKLHRFLIITKRTSVTPNEFTTDILLEFRKFIFDEFEYVAQYPELYPRNAGHRPPRQRLRGTTVVHDLKLLQAFFAELENTDEIRRSPFRKISLEKRRILMHVMYDAPVFLKADELKKVMDTSVPSELQWTKDLFVLNCAIGCRIGDLLRLTMDKVAVSEDGIPYVHYIPSKTEKLQTTNSEVMTPLIGPATEIIKRTGLHFIDKNLHYGKQKYNKTLRQLLQFCGITRRVSIFCHETKENIYMPVYEVASSKLARKTHIDMLTKLQINYYAAGLHRAGSHAVFRYTNLELKDRYELMRAAFGIP